MAFDAHKNFALSLVATAPTPATSGTSLTVTAGEGALFPAVPFNATVAPPAGLPTSANSEIVRVTARAGDVLTLARAQEGSTARAIQIGDLLAATITAKTLKDIEDAMTLSPRASVTRSGVQSVGSSLIVPVNFDVELFDIGNCHDNVTNNSRLTVPAGGDGLYLMVGYVYYDANPNGIRAARFDKSGAFINMVYNNAVSSDITAALAVALAQLVAGDYVELKAFQTSGAPLNVLTASSFSWMKIG